MSNSKSNQQVEKVFALPQNKVPESVDRKSRSENIINDGARTVAKKRITNFFTERRKNVQNALNRLEYEGSYSITNPNIARRAVMSKEQKAEDYQNFTTALNTQSTAFENMTPLDHAFNEAVRTYTNYGKDWKNFAAGRVTNVARKEITDRAKQLIYKNVDSKGFSNNSYTENYFRDKNNIGKISKGIDNALYAQNSEFRIDPPVVQSNRTSNLTRQQFRGSQVVINGNRSRHKSLENSALGAVIQKVIDWLLESKKKETQFDDISGDNTDKAYNNTQRPAKLNQREGQYVSGDQPSNNTERAGQEFNLEDIKKALKKRPDLQQLGITEQDINGLNQGNVDAALNDRKNNKSVDVNLGDIYLNNQTSVPSMVENQSLEGIIERDEIRQDGLRAALTDRLNKQDTTSLTPEQKIIRESALKLVNTPFDPSGLSNIAHEEMEKLNKDHDDDLDVMTGKKQVHKEGDNDLSKSGEPANKNQNNSADLNEVESNKNNTKSPDQSSLGTTGVSNAGVVGGNGDSLSNNNNQDGPKELAQEVLSTVTTDDMSNQKDEVPGVPGYSPSDDLVSPLTEGQKGVTQVINGSGISTVEVDGDLNVATAQTTLNSEQISKGDNDNTNLAGQSGLTNPPIDSSLSSNPGSNADNHQEQDATMGSSGTGNKATDNARNDSTSVNGNLDKDSISGTSFDDSSSSLDSFGGNGNDQIPEELEPVKIDTAHIEAAMSSTKDNMTSLKYLAMLGIDSHSVRRILIKAGYDKKGTGEQTKFVKGSDAQKFATDIHKEYNGKGLTGQMSAFTKKVITELKNNHSEYKDVADKQIFGAMREQFKQRDGVVYEAMKNAMKNSEFNNTITQELNTERSSNQYRGKINGQSVVVKERDKIIKNPENATVKSVHRIKLISGKEVIGKGKTTVDESGITTKKRGALKNSSILPDPGSAASLKSMTQSGKSSTTVLPAKQSVNKNNDRKL